MCKAASLHARTAPDKRCSDTENDGAECLGSEFIELSELSCAIPNDTKAYEFANADDGVQAVADFTDADEAGRTSVPLGHCCGTV